MIPLPPIGQQNSPTLAEETATASGCPTGTDCASHSMTLPAGGAYIAAYSASETNLTLSAPLATYAIDGLSSVPMSGAAMDCTPSEQKTQSYTLASNFSLNLQTLAFTQCQ